MFRDARPFECVIRRIRELAATYEMTVDHARDAAAFWMQHRLLGAGAGRAGTNRG